MERQADHFVLPANRMIQAQVIASRCDRHYLRGVHIEPLAAGGALLIATDGHVLLVQYAPEAIAPRMATMAITLPQEEPELDEEGEALFRDWRGMTLQCPAALDGVVAAGCWWKGADGPSVHVLIEEIKGKYVPWRKVIGAPIKEVHQDGKPRENLFPIGLIGDLASGWRGFRIHTLTGEETAPILTFEDDPHAFAVVMPRRVGVTDNPLPALLALIGEGA